MGRGTVHFAHDFYVVASGSYLTRPAGRGDRNPSWFVWLQGANTAWTEPSTEDVTIAFALFFGGLVQLLAGMWEFRRNNMFAATALSSYGGFWLGFGIYVVLVSGGIIPPSGVHGLQMMLSLWGILTFLFFL